MASRTCSTCGRPVADPTAASCPTCGAPLGRPDDATAVLTDSAAAPGRAPVAPDSGTPRDSGSSRPQPSASVAVGRSAARGVTQLLGPSVGPAGIVVAVASAAALSLPGAIYAFFAEDARSGGAKATVVLLMLLTAAAALTAAAHARQHLRSGEDRVVAAIIVGFGVFAGTYALLQMLTAAAK